MNKIQRSIWLEKWVVSRAHTWALIFRGRNDEVFSVCSVCALLHCHCHPCRCHRVMWWCQVSEVRTYIQGNDDAKEKDKPKDHKPPKAVKGKVFDRIIQIWLENTDFDKAAADRKFCTSQSSQSHAEADRWAHLLANLAFIAKNGLTLSNYFAVTHPSEPNYVSVCASISQSWFPWKLTPFYYRSLVASTSALIVMTSSTFPQTFRVLLIYLRTKRCHGESTRKTCPPLASLASSSSTQLLAQMTMSASISKASASE